MTVLRFARRSVKWQTAGCRVAFLVVMLAALVNVEAANAGALYVLEKSDGVKVFTNRRPVSGQKYKVFTSSSPKYSRIVRTGAFSWRRGSSGVFVPKLSDYDNMIVQAALKHGVEPALVKAVVLIESGFNPGATSPMGAMGLMQLMPGTADRFGVDDAYEPLANVDGGVRYLRFLLDRYNGNRALALAAYNSGEGTVDREGGIPNIVETENYVKNVLKVRDSYRCVNKGLGNC